MRTDNYDVVIVGSGLGGLVSAVLLAMEGYKVLVLEKNKQFGGSLQTFSRDKKIFDTGVHYIGSLAPGQNLYRYFDYLGIMADLKLERMPEIFDFIRMGTSGTTYPIAQGYANFVKHLSSFFPGEGDVLAQYINDLQKVCALFPLYNLEDKDYTFDPLLTLSLADYFDDLTDNRTLQSVLLGNNFLYAGEESTTPFYVHALIVNSYIQSAYKCIRGGSQIVKLLVRRLRALGGVAIRQQEVIRYEMDEGAVKAVHTREGMCFSGKLFISNVTPQTTLKQIGSSYFRAAYYDRILSLPLTVSSFSVHLVVAPHKIPYQAANFYIHAQEKSTRSFAHFDADDWPNVYMVSMIEDQQHKGFAETMTVLTPFKYEELATWHDTFHTVSTVDGRGEDYEDFKKEVIERVFRKLEDHLPGIKENIVACYASTPLSFRDYIGSEEGSLYGIYRNVKDDLKTTVSTQTKIPNLYFTGQNIGLHGVLGVTINAVLTCGNILGQSYLIRKIKEKKNE